MIFVFLDLAYFTYDGNFQAHPCCYKWESSILFWLNNIPLYICTTSSLLTHQSVNIYVVSMSWLLEVEFSNDHKDDPRNQENNGCME